MLIIEVNHLIIKVDQIPQSPHILCLLRLVHLVVFRLILTRMPYVRMLYMKIIHLEMVKIFGNFLRPFIETNMA